MVLGKIIVFAYKKSVGNKIRVIFPSVLKYQIELGTTKNPLKIKIRFIFPSVLKYQAELGTTEIR